MNIVNWAKKNFEPGQDTILVTGASSGIGLEYLKQLASLACTIYAVSEEKEKLEQLATEVSESTSSLVVPVCCDFSSVQQVDELLGKLPGWNIRILVNNAGIGMKGKFCGYSFDDVDRIYRINTCTPMKILLATVPGMVEEGRGVVIQVTTVNVITPIPLNSLYTGGKTAVSSTFSAMAYELRNTGVLFQEVRPGTTQTPFHDKQGVRPRSMLMNARDVAGRSLNNIHQRILFPNRVDRLLAPVVERLPLFLRMRIAFYFLRRRLGLHDEV